MKMENENVHHKRRALYTDSPPHQSQWTVASNWSSVPGTGVTRVASANEVIFLLAFAFAMVGSNGKLGARYMYITAHSMVSRKSEQTRLVLVEVITSTAETLVYTLSQSCMQPLQPCDT